MKLLLHEDNNEDYDDDNNSASNDSVSNVNGDIIFFYSSPSTAIANRFWHNNSNAKHTKSLEDDTTKPKIANAKCCKVKST